MTLPRKAPNPRRTPAGWRRGYAADCKAPPICIQNNTLRENRYRDKDSTEAEPDNLEKSPNQRLSARALAATQLAHAIAACHRDDAVLLMSAALADLSMGAPTPTWLNALDDARWWASFATEIELKAYALACVEAMRPKVKAAFLRHIGGHAA